MLCESQGQVILPQYLLVSFATSLLYEKQLSLLICMEIRTNLCDQSFNNLIVRVSFPLDARKDVVSLCCLYLSPHVLFHRFFSTCHNTAEHGYCKNVFQQFPGNLKCALLIKEQQKSDSQLKPQQECEEYE